MNIIGPDSENLINNYLNQLYKSEHGNKYMFVMIDLLQLIITKIEITIKPTNPLINNFKTKENNYVTRTITCNKCLQCYMFFKNISDPYYEFYEHILKKKCKCNYNK